VSGGSGCSFIGIAEFSLGILVIGEMRSGIYQCPLDEGRAQHLNSKGGNDLAAKFMPDSLALSSALLNSRLAFWSSAK